MLFDLDNWQEIFNTLKKNKLRSILTAFGVFWGIFMLLVMMGVGSGLQNGVNSDFKDRATNSVYIWAQRTSMPYRGFTRGRRYSLDNGDIAALREGIPELADLAPRHQRGNYQGDDNVFRNDKAGAFTFYGDYPDIQQVQLFGISQGRFFNRYDLEEKRKVAVIGEQAVRLLYDKGEDPIGSFIRTQGIFFQVIGVFKSNRPKDKQEEDANTIFIPFTTFQQTFNQGNQVGWFAMTSIPGVPASVVEEKALAILARNHTIAPNDKRAIGHWNAEKEFNKVQNILFGIKAMIWFVGISTLLAGMIGVSNIMLIIVKERTAEIGIRRAIGASPASIIGQIMLETIFLTSVAGYLGLVSGVFVIETVSSIMAQGEQPELFQNPEVDFQIAVIALIILVVSGAIAGLLPAQRAVSIKPVDAIRAS